MNINCMIPKTKSRRGAGLAFIHVGRQLVALTKENPKAGGDALNAGIGIIMFVAILVVMFLVK